MSHQIIRQPDGLYAIFSSVVDDFIVIDCTPEDIIEMRITEQAEEIRRQVGNIIAELEKGGKPYHQFTKSFEDAIKTIRRVHGKNAETLAMLGVVPTGKPLLGQGKGR